MSTTTKKTLSTVTVTPAPAVAPVDLADMKDSIRAKHLGKNLRKQLLWDELNEEWFCYKDNYWQHISELKVRKGIITLLDSEIEEGTNVAFQNNTITSLKIELVKDNWNRDRNLLPVNNGVLNLDTMTLLSHGHSQMFNWKLPYDYDPNAMCPTINAWLLEATSKDHDAIAAIRAAMYFSLLYHPDMSVITIIDVLICTIFDGNNSSVRKNIRAHIYALGPHGCTVVM